MHSSVAACLSALLVSVRILHVDAVRTSLRRNENIGKLQAGYLFPEV